MKRATTLKVLAGTLVLIMVAAAFPLAQVALDATERRAEAAEAARNAGTPNGDGGLDLPFPYQDGGSKTPTSEGGLSPVGGDGASSPPADSFASPFRASASGSVLLSQVAGAAELMGYDVAIPPLPIDKLAGSNPLRAAILTWIAATGSHVPPEELAAELARADAMPLAIQRDVALLLLSAVEANTLQRAALARISPEDLEWIYTHPELANDLARGISTPDTRALALLATLVDMQKSIEATLLMLQAVEATRGTFETAEAQRALATIDTAALDPTTQSILELLISADAHASDSDKVRLAARLVTTGANIALPTVPRATSFREALDALMVATGQVAAPDALAATIARADALPADLSGAVATLLLAQARAIEAANPTQLTTTSQPEALAVVLLAVADVLPVLEKYHLYWRAAPEALRVGEWEPQARAGWAAHHAGLFATTQGGLSDLAAAAFILQGHDLPAPVKVPERSFIDAYFAVAKEGGFTVTPEMRTAVTDASARLSPPVRDAGAMLLSGAAESARLQRIAYADLTPAEASFLRFDTAGLDELYNKPALTRDELARLAQATSLSARVDAHALAQSATVAAQATQQATRILEGAGALQAQGQATKLDTGFFAFLKRLIPFGSAVAQDTDCEIFPGVVDTCGEDVLLRLYYPTILTNGFTPGEAGSDLISVESDGIAIGGTGGSTCNERECVVQFFGGEADLQLLVITGTAGSTHLPQYTDRTVCASTTLVNEVDGSRRLIAVEPCRMESVARYGAPTITLDLDGDDTYRHAVGMVPINATIPVSLHLDMGGADTYLDPSSLYNGYSPLLRLLGEANGHPTSGSAPFGGVAISLDRSGSDSYYAATRSQGYGRLGIGILADTGLERDTYVGTRLVQGAASDTFTLGAGILFDAGGPDSYTSATGQGYGLGGVLVDAGGKDAYVSERAPLGAPLVKLDIIPGGDLTTLDSRADNRVWIDGPGTLSAGLGVDTELVLSAGQGDSDGVPDVIEFLVGTDPKDGADNPVTRPTGRADAFFTDTDRDGYPDYIERALSTDPKNPASYPAGFPAAGVIIPDAVYAIISGQRLDESLDMDGATFKPFEATNATAPGMRGQDKILDLRLPLQDAGSIEYACTGEFFLNSTLPGPTGANNGFEVVTVGSALGTRDNSTNAPRRASDGAPFERCVHVAYEPSGAGEGSAAIPRSRTDGGSPTEGNSFNFKAPAGILAIGDVVKTNYADDYFLVIDLGGNDDFENSAGGALPVTTRPHANATGVTDDTAKFTFLAPSLVLNVDTASQTPQALAGERSRDTYVNASRDFIHGAYFGVLIDTSGNDIYTANDGSQGSLGGILLDLAGTDTYSARDLSQGAGLASVTDRPDRQKDLPNDGVTPADQIGAARESGDVAAHHRAFPGILLDLGEHDPQTFSARSHSQGFARGFPGVQPNANNAPQSYGILFSQDGADRYTALSAGRYVQGVGGVDGVGILLDRSGSDAYTANTFVSQGATISQVVNPAARQASASPHPAAGLLIDLGGQDQYTFNGGGRSERAQNTTITRGESAMTNAAVRFYTDVGVHVDTEFSATNPTAFVAGIGGAGPGGVQTAQFHVHLPTARLAIGTDAATTYSREYAFVVDLGGDNAYRYSAGGLIKDYLTSASQSTVPAAGATSVGQTRAPINLFPVTFLLDAGAGNSTYATDQSLTQGAGFFSVGIVADLGGRDHFEALPQRIPALSSTWVTAPPVIDGTVGADWASVDGQKIRLAAQRDTTYGTEWTIRIANDNKTMYVALEGRSEGGSQSERLRDELIVDLDMGRRQQMWDVRANRTGIDEVQFGYDTSGTCVVSDWGNRGAAINGFSPEALVDAEIPPLKGACRVTDDGTVYYEFQKLLVENTPRDNRDLGFCHDDDSGFGYNTTLRTNASRAVCEFGVPELGLYIEFRDAGAGWNGTNPSNAIPGVFSWPPGAAREDGLIDTRKDGDLHDEMLRWGALGLGNLGLNGHLPRATLVPSLSQGASLAGVGALVMLGSGFSEATLEASDRAQSYASFGGFSLLFDAGGSDTYIGTERTLGAAENLAMAVFLELEGADIYASQNTSLGWVPAGAGAGSGSAMFIDFGGDDAYGWHYQDGTVVDNARNARQATGAATTTPTFSNNVGWVQNNTGIGLDHQVTETLRQIASGLLVQNLYGETRTTLLVTYYDPADADALSNGCTLRSVPTHDANESAMGKFVARSKVCFIATIDTGRGSVNDSANAALDRAGTNGEAIRALTQPTTQDATVGGTIDVQVVDFYIDRIRVGAALNVSKEINQAVSVWATPVDLSNMTDGVTRAKALPTFTANVSGRGVFVFSDDVSDSMVDTAASRSLIINNPPGVGLGLEPYYTGRANATYSPFAYGAAQTLYVNYTVSHDADEDRLAKFNGYRSPVWNTSFPCHGAAERDSEPVLCNQLPFYLPDDPNARLTTDPGSAQTSTPNLMQAEFFAGAPYGRLTDTLGADLVITTTDSIHLAIPGRTKLLPLPYTTNIDIFVIQPDGTEASLDGKRWFLNDPAHHEFTSTSSDIPGVSQLSSLFGGAKPIIDGATRAVSDQLATLQGNILWNQVNNTFDNVTCTNPSSFAAGCEQLHGDLGTGVFRTCRADPPANNLAGQLLWAAVQSWDRRSLQPLPNAPGGAIPPTEVPRPEGARTICKPVRDDLNETAQAAAIDGGVAGVGDGTDVSLAGDAPEGLRFTDFWIDANPTLPPLPAGANYAPITREGDTIRIPKGYKIALEFGLTAGSAVAAGGVGATIADAVIGGGATVNETDTIPETVPGCTLAACNNTRPEDIVVRQLTSFGASNGENLEALAGLGRIPASFYFVQSGAPDNQPRLEFRIPSEATSDVRVSIDDRFTGETVRELQPTTKLAGDMFGTPTRDHVNATSDDNPAYWTAMSHPARVNWTVNASSPRWTQHSIAYNGDDLGDGLYSVTVHAKDAAGERTNVSTVLIDRTAPTTRVLTNEFAGKAYLVGGSLPVRWNAIDIGPNGAPGSGIEAVHVFTRSHDEGDLGDMSSWTRHAPFSPSVRSTLVNKGSSTTHLLMAIGVDRAGNVEGTANEPDLETAIAQAFATKLAVGADPERGYLRVTIDTLAPRFSTQSLDGGRLLSYQGSEVRFLRAGQPVTFTICASDAETDIGQVVLAVDHIDPITSKLFSGVFAAQRGGACGTGGVLYTSSAWHLENENQTKYPEGIWAALFEVFDKAGNRIRVSAGNLVLDHASPTVDVEAPVLPAGQTAVKPGDLVKIRLAAQDAFGVDEAAIRVDASAFTQNTTPIATRPARVNGVIYQEASFTVDRTGLSNAGYNVTLRVPDLAGNVTTVHVPIAVNARPFEFVADSFRITNITHNSAVIRWETTEPTSASLRYDTSTVALNRRTPTDTNATTEHAVNLTGLVPSTRYHLRAISASTGGLSKESPISSFETTSALFLELLTPEPEEKVHGVVKVAFRGGLLDSTDFVKFTLEVRDDPTKAWKRVGLAERQGERHELNWNSSQYLDGTTYELRLSAEAGRDSASATVGPLTSDNTPPSVLVLSPLLATNDTTPKLVAEAADLLSGFGQLPAALFIDDVLANASIIVDTLPSGRIRLTHEIAEPLAAGTRTFELRVEDTAGNLARERWQVAIDADAPDVTVNPTRYAPGTAAAKLGGTVTLNLTITDASGVAHAVADATALATGEELRLVKIVNTNEWQATFTVTDASASALHAIPVRVVDLAGNERTLAIPVPVDNVAPILQATQHGEAEHTRGVVHIPANELILVQGTARSPQSPPVTAANVTAAESATLVFAGLLPSRTYEYTLDVTDVAGNHVPVVGRFATKDDVIAPGSMGVVSVRDLLNGTLSLSWDAATDDVGVAFYRVYRSDDGVTYRVLAEASGTTHLDAGLPYEKAYLYKVAAVDHGANEGPASPTLRASATAVPSLTTGIVSPAVGTPSTPFRYTITYLSPGGVAPDYVRVNINGVPQNMTLQSGDANTGAVYVHETRHAPHQRDAPHNYAFEASDGRYTARFPADGTVLRGPLVTGDALANEDVTGLAAFAQRVPFGGVASLGIAVLLALAITVIVTRKKEGSK